MPVSDVANLSPIMTEVQRLQPKSVLDIGVGVGKYGVLCREVLDGVYGRVNPEVWESIIIGVEAFAQYANPAWEMYDDVAVFDFASDYEPYREFDLVLMIDSLEHMEPTVGATVLRYLVEHNKRVIVSVPLGVCPQGACFGNEFETHRTTYHGERDFEQYKYQVLHRGQCLVISINGVRE